MNLLTFEVSHSPAAEETIEQIARHVSQQLHGRVVAFRLESCGCGIVLKGRARTYHAKQVAQHAVMVATDMPIVSNAIEVKPSEGIRKSGIT